MLFRVIFAGILCSLLAVIWGSGMLLFMLISGVKQLNGWPPVILVALAALGAILSLGGLTILMWQTIQEDERNG